jgi:hypothetical protein
MGTYYDHGKWSDIPPDMIDMNSEDDPVIAWNITWARNPWFSLGIHIDHKWPMIAIHLPFIILYIGRQDHWSFTNGLRTL